MSLFAKIAANPMANKSKAFTVNVMSGKLSVVRMVSSIFFPPVKSVTPSHDGLSFVRVPEFSKRINQAEYLGCFAYKTRCSVERTRLNLAHDQNWASYLL